MLCSGMKDHYEAGRSSEKQAGQSMSEGLWQQTFDDFPALPKSHTADTGIGGGVGLRLPAPGEGEGRIGLRWTEVAHLFLGMDLEHWSAAPP